MLLSADHLIQLAEEGGHKSLGKPGNAHILAGNVCTSQLLAVFEQHTVLIVELIIRILFSAVIRKKHRAFASCQQFVDQAFFQEYVSIHNEHIVPLQKIPGKPTGGDGVGHIIEGIVVVGDHLVLQYLTNDLLAITQHQCDFPHTFLAQSRDGILNQLLPADIHRALGVAGKITADTGTASGGKN